MKLPVILSLLFTCLLAQPASAVIIIYQDTFNRTGELHGSAPDVRPGTETWTVTKNVDDTAATSSSQLNLFAASGRNVSATLPFDPGTTPFYVEATLDTTSGSDWLYVGFSTSQNNAFADFRGWALLKQDGNIQAFKQSTSGQWYNAYGGGNGLLTIRIDIDPTAVNPTIALSINGSEIDSDTLTTAQLDAIQYVGIGSRNSTGYIDSFTVGVIPEPSSGLLVMGALGSMLLLRRRRAASKI